MLVLAQQPPGVVVEQQDHRIEAVLNAGSQLLDVELEAAVPGDADDLAVRGTRLGADSRGQPEPQTSPGRRHVGPLPVGVETVVGAAVVADAYVAGEDRVPRGRRADRLHDAGLARHGPPLELPDRVPDPLDLGGETGVGPR